MSMFNVDEEETSENVDMNQVKVCLCNIFGGSLDGIGPSLLNLDDILKLNETEDSVKNHSTPVSWATTTCSQVNDYQTSMAIMMNCSRVLSAFSDNYSDSIIHKLSSVFYTYVCSIICLFGFLGNLANVFLLIPQGRKCSMGRMEKSVYWGLISLAMSDLLFCVCVIPRMITDKNVIVPQAPNFSLYYFTYSDALVHLFAMISTWLTVAMAMGRYLAICKPFTARAVIGRTAAKRTIAGIFLICFIVSLPRFFCYRVETLHCRSSIRYYIREPILPVRPNLLFDQIYNWFYFLAGIIIPFACLIFSNAFLIKTLGKAKTTLKYCRVVKRQQNSSQNQQSSSQQPLHTSHNKVDTNNLHFLHQKLQHRYTPVHLYSPSLQPQKHQNYYNQFVQHQNSSSHQTLEDQYRPITLTLIVLVLTYIIFVTPSEIFLFIRRCILSERQGTNILNNFLATIANTLQATNYSLNFLLYYAINVNFRKSVTNAFCCFRSIFLPGCSISLTSVPVDIIDNEFANANNNINSINSAGSSTNNENSNNIIINNLNNLKALSFKTNTPIVIS
ncbi:hypothetical protein HELRODRAFT_160962 [Helobdella robusta]|uniref:G-protein coupled receptors family 1 profile domain-containing protein n=1 Tax=Helobdella robusta TaxID=6412 RepID=T1EQX2_HELRO|nr:hypothetical protein HELRODRAFT_160962 [Helobdella robusta]ESO01795.1 hypothetical protein HELRODRAFT_160962 [Helobdella robusta]